MNAKPRFQEAFRQWRDGSGTSRAQESRARQRAETSLACNESSAQRSVGHPHVTLLRALAHEELPAVGCQREAAKEVRSGGQDSLVLFCCRVDQIDGRTIALCEQPSVVGEPYRSGPPPRIGARPQSSRTRCVSNP